jgi:hypothetical protein
MVRVYDWRGDCGELERAKGLSENYSFIDTYVNGGGDFGLNQVAK